MEEQASSGDTAIVGHSPVLGVSKMSTHHMGLPVDRILSLLFQLVLTGLNSTSCGRSRILVGNH